MAPAALGRVTSRVALAAYAAGLVLWLMVGLLPILVDFVPAVADAVGSLAAGAAATMTGTAVPGGAVEGSSAFAEITVSAVTSSVGGAAADNAVVGGTATGSALADLSPDGAVAAGI